MGKEQGRKGYSPINRTQRWGMAPLVLLVGVVIGFIIATSGSPEDQEFHSVIVGYSGVQYRVGIDFDEQMFHISDLKKPQGFLFDTNDGTIYHYNESGVARVAHRVK